MDDIQQIIHIKREKQQIFFRRQRNQIRMDENRMNLSQPQTLDSELVQLNKLVTFSNHLDSLKKLHTFVLEYDSSNRKLQFGERTYSYDEETYNGYYIRAYDIKLITHLLDNLQAYGDNHNNDQQKIMIEIDDEIIINLVALDIKVINTMMVQLQILQRIQDLLNCSLNEEQVEDVLWGISNMALECCQQDSQQLNQLDYQTILDNIKAFPNSQSLQTTAIWVLASLFHENHKIGITQVYDAFLIYQRYFTQYLESDYQIASNQDNNEIINQFIEGFSDYCKTNSKFIDYIYQKNWEFQNHIIYVLNKFNFILERQNNDEQHEKIVQSYLRILYYICQLQQRYVKNQQYSHDIYLTIISISLQYLSLKSNHLTKCYIMKILITIYECDQEFYKQRLIIDYDKFQQIVFSMRIQPEEEYYLELVLSYYQKVTFGIPYEIVGKYIESGLLLEYVKILNEYNMHSSEVLQKTIGNIACLYALGKQFDIIQQELNKFDIDDMITKIYNNSKYDEVVGKADEFQMTFIDIEEDYEDDY